MFRENLIIKLILVYQSMTISVIKLILALSKFFFFLGGGELLLSCSNSRQDNMNMWLWNIKMKINCEILLGQQFFLAETLRSLKAKSDLFAVAFARLFDRCL